MKEKKTRAEEVKEAEPEKCQRCGVHDAGTDGFCRYCEAEADSEKYETFRFFNPVNNELERG